MSNQKLKILHLLKILYKESDENHPIKTQDLINKLEQEGISCERKSLYHDIQTLQEFNVDIMHKKDTPKGYYLCSREFELPELKILVDVVQASKFITAKKSQELIAKIEGLASIHEAKQLHRQVFVDNRVKLHNKNIYYNVDKIHSGIQMNRIIKFQYYEWDINMNSKPRRDGKKYHISPWVVEYKDDNYYMIGFDQEAKHIKHYRIDKMDNIELTKEKREGKKEFEHLDVAKYSASSFGMFGGNEKLVTLVGEEYLVGAVIDRFGTNINLERKGNKFHAKVKVQISKQFFGWLVGLGENITIESPKSVREEYYNHLHIIVNKTT